MRTRLLSKALLYNLDAHRANPANLIAGAVGMFVNNSIFLAGIWAMLFAGKSANGQLVPYYIALYAIVTASFGAVHFFFGGLRASRDYITDGTLEPMLATPRDPILLAAVSRSSPFALGDLLMGIAGIGLVAWKFGGGTGLRSLAAALISAIAFAAVSILTGAISFYIPRGTQVGTLVFEMVISLSVYPVGKMFLGPGRLILLLTPAAATAILPLDAVERATLAAFAWAALAAAGLFVASVVVFRLGVRRYRSISLVGVGRSI